MDALWMLFFITVSVLWVASKLKGKPKPAGAPKQPATPKQTASSEARGDARFLIEVVPPTLSVTTSVGDAVDRSDRDNWEGSFWEATDVIAVSAELHLRYQDGAGNLSERDVLVRQLGHLDSAQILIGHCHMRDSTRTFRTDRILECVDLDTGEVVADVAAFLRGKYDASPERAKEALRAQEADALKIMLYLAKADGRVTAREKGIIREVAHALLEDSRLTDQMIDRTLAEFGAPSQQAFKLAVGRVAKTDESRKSAVVDAARRMVATEKTIAEAEAEAEALRYIERRLTP